MDVVDNPGRFISRDITRGETVDADLNNLIEKRHERRVADEGERAVEEVWKAAERREEAERQAEWRAGRKSFLEHLGRVYARLSDESFNEAARL